MEKILGVTLPVLCVKGIVEDVVYVQKDFLFVARKGENYNSLKDIEQAILLGGIVLHEDKNEEKGCYVENLSDKLEEVLSYFYKDISFRFKIVGVCGTNGKSSVVHHLYHLLQDLHVMRIGSGIVETKTMKMVNRNTTPGVITLMNFYVLLKKKM